MSPTRTIATIVVAGTLAVSGACGSAEKPAPDTAAATRTSPSTTAASPTPVVTPAATRTPTPKPKPKPSATPAAGGDGGADGNAAPSTAGGGVCSHLGADQVGEVLGVAVRGTAVPGETGCKFDQGGKRGSSVTVLDRSTAKAGGMDGAKAEATSAVEGDPQDVAGIGSAAFVVTGSMFGGPDINGAGAVQVGGRIISVYLEQHSGLAADKVRALVVELLKLVARAAD
jgi:hypothetical protein